MTYDNGRAELAAKLDDVAQHMDGWTVEAPEDRNPRLVNADGVQIWGHVVTYGAGVGRAELSAAVPADAQYSEGDYSGIDRPEITVSLSRDSAALARDIMRRLVPGAVDYWTTVSDRVARRVARKDARQALAGELAEIMGGRVYDSHRDGWQAEQRGHTYGRTMTPSYDAESVTVELRNLTPGEARELATLIAGWEA